MFGMSEGIWWDDFARWSQTVGHPPDEGPEDVLKGVSCSPAASASARPGGTLSLIARLPVPSFKANLFGEDAAELAPLFCFFHKKLTDAGNCGYEGYQVMILDNQGAKPSVEETFAEATGNPLR